MRKLLIGVLVLCLLFFVGLVVGIVIYFFPESVGVLAVVIFLGWVAYEIGNYLEKRGV